MPVRDEGRTLQTPSGAQPHPGGEFVAEKADHARGDENRKVRQCLRVDEPVQRFNPGNGRGDENGEHDRVARPPFTPIAPQPERDPERDGRERITRVVNQVGEQCDRTRQRENKELHPCRNAKDRQAPKHGMHPITRAHDRRVDPSVRMTVTVIVMLVMCAISIAMRRGVN